MSDSAEKRTRRVNYLALSRRNGTVSPLIPEIRLDRKEAALGLTEKVIYHVFPEPMQRFLARVLPGNDSISRVLEVTDFRKEHGIPKSYFPF